MVVQIRVECLTGHLFDQPAEHVRADVAVDHDAPRKRVERRREHQLGEAVRIVRDLVVRFERRQSGRVRQQMAHGDALFVGPGPRRDIALQRRVEIDAMLFDELHDRARHTQDLRQRRDVPQRMLVGRWTRRPVQMADGILRDDSVACSDDSDRAGKRAVGKRGVEDATDRHLNRRIAGWSGDRGAMTCSCGPPVDGVR